MTLKELKFTLTDGRFVSEPVQLRNENAAIQIESSGGTLSLERSITNDKYSLVPDFSPTLSGVMGFNLAGGVQGQFLRVVCSVEPVGCYILL